MFVWLLFACFVANTAFSVTAPILPIELEAKGVTGGAIGLTFTVYSLGIVFWSPIVGKYLVNRYSAHNLVGVSLTILGASFMCFGLMKHFTNSNLVLVYMCTLRII